MTTAITPCGGSTTTSTAKPAAAHACCTELECFEKPRFFCGQLLTDVDLEAAVSYVAAKNRLHNRHLFGAGVVCGLAVRCDPCNRGAVIVESGYALDCNGNDIIVCSDQPFDVKGSIDRRKKEHQADCKGGKSYLPEGCEEGETEYCLVLSYEEKPGKPVNALVKDNGCRASRCEPSRTLERFRLDLITKATAEKLNVRPSAWSRIGECLVQEQAKLTAFQSEIGKVTTTQQLQPVYARIRASLLDFAKRSGLTHCNLIDEVCAIDKQFREPPAETQPPDNAGPAVDPNNPSTGSTTPIARVAINRLSALYARLLADCICNALLVPCGECCDPDYVLLACLTIEANGTKVTSICNTVRTQVITGPAVRYWAQPLFDGIGNGLESFCCPEPLRDGVQTDIAGRARQASAIANVAGAYASPLLRRTPAPGVVSSLDFFQQPLASVLKRLEELKVEAVVTTTATVEEAFRLENLRDFSWEIPPNSHVELIVAPDKTIAAIRVLRAQS